MRHGRLFTGRLFYLEEGRLEGQGQSPQQNTDHCKQLWIIQIVRPSVMASSNLKVTV